MIYITGDTHAVFTRFSSDKFPKQKEMTKDDHVIICGDFGGIWDVNESSKSEKYWLDWLNDKPFTTLFADGNHSNFDRLYSDEFEIVDYHGGKAHRIHDSIYHLMRGEIFNLENKKFFVFGGASSHDISDGILNKEDYPSIRELIKDYNRRTKKGEMLRINHVSWWEQELPSTEEMENGRRNLQKHNYKVDYIISHTPPQQITAFLGYYGGDKLTFYFDDLINQGLKFKEWYSGHLHIEKFDILGKYNILYRNIYRIV